MFFLFEFLIFFLLLALCGSLPTLENIYQTSCSLNYKQVEEKLLQNPLDFVNLLAGTNSRYDMSYGCTLPLITRPQFVRTANG
jgi:hypothetical protein